MKPVTLWRYSLLLAVIQLVAVGRLLTGSRLTAGTVFEAAVVLIMIVGLQVRSCRVLRWDLRDEEGNPREDWKLQFCMIVLGFQLTFGVFLWLATDLLHG